MSEPFAQYPHGPYLPYGQYPEPPRRHHGRTLLGLTATAIVAAGVGAGAAIGLSHGSTPGSTATSTSKNVLTTAQIASRVDPAIVDVTSTLGYQQATAKGTGIVLTANGEILTNNHVIDGATSISVTDVGNGKTYKASVVGYDASHDIAVLQLSGASGLTTASTGESATVSVGDSVVALGNAGGVGGTPAVATGSVTALNQAITATDEGSGSSEQLTGLIETNAAIQAGDSGGPLVNSHAQVIGIDTAASTNYQFGGNGSGGFGGDGSGSSNSAGGAMTQGYAIPIGTALSIAREIEAGHASSTVHIGATAFIGLEIASQQSSYYQGVVLAGARAGTPAANAGLGQGDVVTALNGHSVSSGTQIQQILVGLHPGDKVSISWTDSSTGQSHTANLTLTNGPAA
jgi:S1-C subfamily serine protease